MNTDSKHRIVHAADTLYEQGSCARFPTVDAVRRQARVSMNDANTVMKQWRHTHLSGRQTEPAKISPWTKRASHFAAIDADEFPAFLDTLARNEERVCSSQRASPCAWCC